MNSGDQTSRIAIRKAVDSDWDGIWPIFRAVVARGDSFAFSPDTPESEARGYFIGPGIRSYVAIESDLIVGAYYLRANQRGLGDHIANAGYMTHPVHTGRGIGRRMGEHSLQEARAAGFRAMQFNFVVSTNEVAIKLWKSLGFRIIGTIPSGFRHAGLGLVDAYIMFTELD